MMSKEEITAIIQEYTTLDIYNLNEGLKHNLHNLIEILILKRNIHINSELKLFIEHFGTWLFIEKYSMLDMQNKQIIRIDDLEQENNITTTETVSDEIEIIEPVIVGENELDTVPTRD